MYTYIYTYMNAYISSKHIYMYNNSIEYILADQANFPLILAILRRFSPPFVFSPISTAASCQDADFFQGMIYTHIYLYIHYTCIRI